MNDEQKFTPGPDNREHFRAAMGRFATGVTIVTTQSDIGPLGMTANSFSSISMEPPLVMWAPGRGSRRHDAFVNAQSFCIHILAEGQFALAKHFATQGEGFDAFDWTIGADNVPLLAGCAAQIHCTQHSTIEAGDHTMILGNVTEASYRDVSGLIFHNGKFGQFHLDD